MKLSKNLEMNIFLNIYWNVQVLFAKVQAHSSLESPFEYNRDQMLWRINVDYDFYNQRRSYRNIM